MRSAGAGLPGLDGLWSLEAVPDLDLGGVETGLGRAFGRGGILRAGDVVIRPYRRGGLVRHLNERLYPTPWRFRREFQVHRALWAAGLPTVEPLGWACRRRLWGWEGAYLTRWAEGVPWPRAWERSPQVLAELRTLLKALGAWGLLAPDLNATNILVRPSGSILALDWDRAGWTRNAGLMDRYRSRLVRSLEKLGAPPMAVAEMMNLG
ncbi:MAG: lipopolysaccharide kinase InaA family protein [Holophaga sp.]